MHLSCFLPLSLLQCSFSPLPLGKELQPAWGIRTAVDHLCSAAFTMQHSAATGWSHFKHGTERHGAGWGESLGTWRCRPQDYFRQKLHGLVGKSLSFAASLPRYWPLPFSCLCSGRFWSRRLGPKKRHSKHPAAHWPGLKWSLAVPDCPGRDGLQSVQASRGFSEIPHVFRCRHLPTMLYADDFFETVATVALRQGGIVLSQQDPVSRGKRRNLSSVFSCLSCLALFTCVCIWKRGILPKLPFYWKYELWNHQNKVILNLVILDILGGFPTFFMEIHNMMSILSHKNRSLKSRRIFAA